MNNTSLLSDISLAGSIKDHNCKSHNDNVHKIKFLTHCECYVLEEKKVPVHCPSLPCELTYTYRYPYVMDDSIFSVATSR